MAKLFFSYSHRNEGVRDELEVHLAMLKRQKVIETWHDRRIVAGDEFNGQISEHLETADIILLLVSPYFLDSDYCYDVEMTRAMERHEQGLARVIPVIVDPCDWHAAPFGKLLAMPEDGRPISKFPNVHDAFLQITTAIRQAANRDLPQMLVPPQEKKNPPKTAELVAEQPRSSNLRIKKKFSERDRDRFREEAFKYIASFFEGSLSELGSRSDSIETEFKRIDANTFTSAIYENGHAKSECAISLSNSFGGNGIVYSTDKSSRGSSCNSMLTVVDDGTSLGLSASMNFGLGRSEQGQLTLEGAAEAFWSILILPLQR